MALFLDLIKTKVVPRGFALALDHHIFFVVVGGEGFFDVLVSDPELVEGEFTNHQSRRRDTVTRGRRPRERRAVYWDVVIRPSAGEKNMKKGGE